MQLCAQNLANISSSGYKRKVDFAALTGSAEAPSAVTRIDFSPGKQIATGSPLDFAIEGKGFFAVRSGEAILYTRSGQFHRDDEGHLATPSGAVLQAAGGGDVAVSDDAFKLQSDGTVIEAGAPVARLAVVDFVSTAALAASEDGLFAAPAALAQPVDIVAVRQGALEASNVSNGDEMVTMMEALRRAETGQRLVQVYDDLMGRALTNFGQAS